MVNQHTAPPAPVCGACGGPATFYSRERASWFCEQDGKGSPLHPPAPVERMSDEELIELFQQFDSLVTDSKMARWFLRVYHEARRARESEVAKDAEIERLCGVIETYQQAVSGNMAEAKRAWAEIERLRSALEKITGITNCGCDRPCASDLRKDCPVCIAREALEGKP